MFWAIITYRQRQPHGADVPKTECETTRNGPFVTQQAAEHFAASVANTTAVFEARIIEEG
jgi:hypothetical protein